MSCVNRNNRLKRPTDPDERQRYEELVELGRKARKASTKAYIRERKLHARVAEEFGRCMTFNWHRDIWK